VVARDEFYYLFYSGDICCGEMAHYALLVARSRSATGPFERFGEASGAESSAILERDERWNAPGHNSVVRDATGQDWLLYHAIDNGNPWLHLSIGGGVESRRLACAHGYGTLNCRAAGAARALEKPTAG
jgi:beta-xylosidase